MARPKDTKDIKNAEMMLELFEAYKKHVKENPFIVTDWVGGIGKEVQRKKEKPLSLEGFSVYVYNQGVTTSLTHYFNNTNKKYENYLSICASIREEIRQEQIAGGMAGIYNASLTARLNGLTDKTESRIDLSGSLDVTLNL